MALMLFAVQLPVCCRAHRPPVPQLVMPRRLHNVKWSRYHARRCKCCVCSHAASAMQVLSALHNALHLCGPHATLYNHDDSRKRPAGCFQGVEISEEHSHTGRAGMQSQVQSAVWHTHASSLQQRRHAEDDDRAPLQSRHQPVRPHLPQHRGNETQHEDCDAIVVPATTIDTFMH